MRYLAFVYLKKKKRTGLVQQLMQGGLRKAEQQVEM